MSDSRKKERKETACCKRTFFVIAVGGFRAQRYVCRSFAEKDLRDAKPLLE